MIDKCMYSSVVHLKDESLTLFQEYIKNLNDLEMEEECKNNLVSLLLAESSFC